MSELPRPAQRNYLVFYPQLELCDHWHPHKISASKAFSSLSIYQNFDEVFCSILIRSLTSGIVFSWATPVLLWKAIG